MKKFTICLVTLLLTAVLGLSAAPWYDTGSQIFTITVGPSVPLTGYIEGTGSTGIGPGAGKTNISLGGHGSIAYQVFVHPYIALGGELGYRFYFGNDSKVMTNVPMLFKVSAFPVQGRFELPFSLGVGMNYMSYRNISKLTLEASFEIGARFYFNDEWGMGIQSGITLLPELYTIESMKQYNSLFTYIPATISVSYRH